MSTDILHLFSKFGLGHLLCRLSLEKHDGISAVQLILSLCLFRINGETIHSMYKKGFYGLLETGKNCYYRMLERPSMDWRRLMNYTVIRFMCVLRKNGIQTEDENSCVIIDDTALEKSGKFMGPYDEGLRSCKEELCSRLQTAPMRILRWKIHIAFRLLTTRRARQEGRCWNWKEAVQTQVLYTP